MNKSIILILMTFFSLTTYATNKHLICVTDDMMDMDIKLENIGSDREKLTVILTEMDGVTKHKFVNSTLPFNTLLDAEKDGFTVVVAKKDVASSIVSGGTFQNAGMIQMAPKDDKTSYDVLVAALGMVFQGQCK